MTDLASGGRSRRKAAAVMLTIAACIDARTFRHDRLEMGILIEQRFLSYMSVLFDLPPVALSASQLYPPSGQNLGNQAPRVTVPEKQTPKQPTLEVQPPLELLSRQIVGEKVYKEFIDSDQRGVNMRRTVVALGYPVLNPSSLS
jgi:hypothetical protein